jgi:2Fe-2S ferredoxin
MTVAQSPTAPAAPPEAESAIAITVENRGGDRITVSGQEGLSVMEVIRDHSGGELLALCGGCCSCATCHVYVDAEWLDRLPPMSADEDDLLDSSDARTERSRLSCQLRCTAGLSGMSVKIAPED